MASEDEDDRALVERFLAKWKGVSGPKVAAAVPGVLQRDVSRWRSSDFDRLSEEKREALRADLQRTPDQELAEKRIASKWFRLMADRLDAEVRQEAATPPTISRAEAEEVGRDSEEAAALDAQERARHRAKSSRQGRRKP